MNFFKKNKIAIISIAIIIIFVVLLLIGIHHYFGDYFKYSVFFDSCNILCTDIFQRIPALEKHRKTASGSDRMHVDRRDLPEYGFPGGNPKFHLSGIHESE